MLKSPLFVIVGVACMAATARGMLRFFPLLEVEKRAHKDSLPLDGLRGLLASSVLFHHASIWFLYARTGHWDAPESILYAQLGPAAVTVFFFISGYLFWDKALRKPEAVAWRKLLPNRMRRILPAYWAAALLILLSGLAAAHFHRQEPVSTLGKQGAEWLLGGFPQVGSPGVDGVDGTILSAGVFWTLRMEWIFYALLPLLLWFRRWWRLPLLFAGSYLLFRVSASLLKASAVQSHLGTFILVKQFLNMLAVCFSVGMVAAYRPWNERVRVWMRSPWAAVGATVCLCAGLLRNESYTLSESLLLAPVFLAVLAGNSFGGLFSNRPMRALGQVSYSIYILHGVLLFDMLSLWRRFLPLATLSGTAYAVLIWFVGVLIATLATLSYWYIERPFNGRAPGQQPGSGRTAES